MATLRSVAQDLKNGTLTFEEAVAATRGIEFAEKKTDVDGEPYYEGSEDNTSVAVLVELPHPLGNQFLNAILDERS